MTEAHPELPVTHDQPAAESGAAFLVRQSLEPEDNAAPEQSTTQAAPLGQAYLDDMRMRTAAPGMAHTFVINHIRTMVHDPSRVPFLPANTVMHKLQDEIVPADLMARYSEAQRAERRTDRDAYLEVALRHSVLPEISQTIRLRQELRTLGRRKEAEKMDKLMEAYGRVIAEMPSSHPVLKWSDAHTRRRV